MQNKAAEFSKVFVQTIDLKLQRSHLASSHLLVAGAAAALVDVGATQNHRQILSALEEKGVSCAAVKLIFVTHVHLDHAGAAGFLLHECFPNARVVVHPLGAPHLIAPAKLEAAAREVYGQEVFDQIYGRLLPVPAERLVLATDGLEFDLESGEILPHQEQHLDRHKDRLGQRPMQPKARAHVMHTPGHARHHYCLYLPEDKVIFTGDAYGLAYPELTVAGVPFLFPTTTPTAFEPDEMLRSIEKIAALQPKSAYLTHFGVLPEPQRYLAHLKARILKHVELAQNVQQPLALGHEEKSRVLAELMVAWVSAELEKHGCDVKMALQVLEMDIKLNVQGLLFWLGRRQKG